jgi:curved DNA-binding protein CbpA
VSSNIAASSASSDVRGFVAEKLSLAKRSEYYGLLGVNSVAKNTEIDRAYRLILERLEDRNLKRAEHADLWLPVQRIQRELARAYSILTEPHRRAGYDRRLGSPEVWPVRQAWSAAAAARLNGVDATIVAHISAVRCRPENDDGQADQLYEQGRAAARAQNWPRAEEFFHAASRLEPDNPGHMRELGWAVFADKDRLTPERMRLGRDLMQEACINAPWQPDSRYRMAQYWRETGNARRYQLELQATLRCDHEHEGAAAELRTLGELAGRDSSEDSGWSRFWRRLSTPTR